MSAAKQIKFGELARLAHKASEFAQLDDMYIYLRMEYDRDSMPDMPKPISIVGLTLCLVDSGELTCIVNDKPLHLQRNTLLSFPQSALVSIDASNSNQGAYEMLFLAPAFLQDLNLDFSVVNIPDLIQSAPSPTVQLSDNEAEMLRGYLRLMAANAKENREVRFAHSIGRSLTQAFVYQMLQVHMNHRDSRIKDDMRGNQTRQIAYLQEFMTLVQVHFSQHRSVNFYAERLCISPKYLSHLVKAATGRSASEWVAQFVLQEAKNMLRFSNKSIQQVAYALNFPSQSAFGKYFKHLTGLSPKEYQNG